MDMQLEIQCAYELIPSAYWCIDGIGTLSNYCARERKKKMCGMGSSKKVISLCSFCISVSAYSVNNERIIRF
jgi:hypothetical protein